MCDARLGRNSRYYTGPFERGKREHICTAYLWNCCWGEPGASPGRIHVKVCVYPNTQRERVVYDWVSEILNPGDTRRLDIYIKIPEDVDTAELPLGIKVWCEGIEAEPSW